MKNDKFEMKIQDLTNEIKILKRNNKTLLFLIVIIIGLFITIILHTNNRKEFDQIVTRELIVKDSKNNDRIIISPEITTSDSRKRKDTLNGVLIIDQNGHDRVIVGSSPFVKINDTVVKRAVDGPYGIAFNDENGAEKGGMGYYSDRGLSALGLDGPSGEGIVLFVPKKELFGQKVGIIINDPQEGGQLFFIGANLSGDKFINMDSDGIGRFAIEMDSTSHTSLKYYDFQTGKSSAILNSN